MITHNPNSLCSRAKLYYYDLLRQQSRGPVPESTAKHIEQCQHCRDELIKLKSTLAQPDSVESGEGHVDPALATLLKLHFAYVGKHVTCQIAKPFLPILSAAHLDIVIPTPITVHIDKCQQCANDLKTIRQLNLTEKQLYRLARLFAEKPSCDVISCSKTQKALPAVALMAFNRTDSETLKHLCTCPACRDLLYERRQNACDALPPRTRSPGFPCESVSAADFFDYVVPYGIDPLNDQYAKFRRFFTSHVIACPECLAKMQKLHKTLYDIAEQPESDVITIYNIDESAKIQAGDASDVFYTGFPIMVKVIGPADKEAEPSATAGFRAALKEKVSTINPRPLFKPAVAAAAAMLIATALLFNIPSAKAVTLESIYKAVEKIRNVYIASLVANQKEPIQELWVSRTLNSYITKTADQLTLWDLPNAIRKSKQLNTAVTETIPLTAVLIADVEKKITGSLGLLPFDELSAVSEDAEWNNAADSSLKVREGIEVYDLMWVEKAYDGSAVFNKWRVFVDPVTNLPRRTEFYKKLPVDDQYLLKSVKLVQYLSDSEVQTVIKDAGL
jgi:hypothetical protein